VAECAVASLPHAYWGEQVTAWVVVRTNDSVDAHTLTELCKQRLSPYKVPKEIRFIEALPRNSMGKILRRVLRDA
jgi:acyl-CoA synthetase (AMP-forming)/AMP-acid ligase II